MSSPEPLKSKIAKQPRRLVLRLPALGGGSLQRRTLLLVLLDLAIAFLAYGGAFFLRSLSGFGVFPTAMPLSDFAAAPHAFWLLALGQPVVLWCFGLYRESLWEDMRGTAVAAILAIGLETAILAGGSLALFGNEAVKLSILPFFWALNVGMILVSRLLLSSSAWAQASKSIALTKLPFPKLSAFSPGAVWRSIQDSRKSGTPTIELVESELRDLEQLRQNLQALKDMEAALAGVAREDEPLKKRLSAEYRRRESGLFQEISLLNLKLRRENALLERSRALRRQELQRLEAMRDELKLRQTVGEFSLEELSKREEHRLSLVEDHHRSIAALDAILLRLEAAMGGSDALDRPALMRWSEWLAKLQEAGIIERVVRASFANLGNAIVVVFVVLVVVALLWNLMGRNSASVAVADIAYILLIIGVAFKFVAMMRGRNEA